MDVKKIVSQSKFAQVGFVVNDIEKAKKQFALLFGCEIPPTCDCGTFDVTQTQIYGKPAPDVFLLAAKRLGVKPENCLVLEDSKAGIKAAKSAGATVYMVPDMFIPDKEVIEITDNIVENLGEVIEIFKKIN